MAMPIVTRSLPVNVFIVHEPRPSSLTMGFGAMRNTRTLSRVFGLGIFINYVFNRPQKEDK